MAAAGGLVLAGGGWEAALLPGQGAAMARLAWRGRDILVPLPHGADPNGSFAGAFLMAPWTNRLDAGRLPVAGTTYHLPVNRIVDDTAIHGLVRDAAWTVEAQSGSHAVLAQTGDAEAAGIPWHWQARLEVSLDAAGAAVALTLGNAGALPFPFGCGWHPFFLRPAGTRLRFAAGTLFARDARCLPIAAQPSTGVDGDEAAYEGLDTHFAGWDGVAEIRRPDLALRIAAAGAWAGNLQVFAPAGSGILCVEPVSHVPDAPNRPDFARFGPLGMLAPGESLQARVLLSATD
ncbi:aldose epimerase family protein [Paracraurococcus lichenis]|uniref:Aldose epimerase n=1 Tax=Paracraurococcus lichenis TaxID=3064888 RepID=A0ABT9DUL7_9PROT|nr:aldose epimerase [Paracraurococcus sp. LOR1-02]MDO9707578.1 aldose epimerase [Paracraurococcus sp. LOR1-02]